MGGGGLMMLFFSTFFSPVRHRGAALLRATAPAAPQSVYETMATSLYLVGKGRPGPPRRSLNPHFWR